MSIVPHQERAEVDLQKEIQSIVSEHAKVLPDDPEPMIHVSLQRAYIPKKHRDFDSEEDCPCNRRSRFVIQRSFYDQDGKIHHLHLGCFFGWPRAKEARATAAAFCDLFHASLGITEHDPILPAFLRSRVLAISEYLQARHADSSQVMLQLRALLKQMTKKLKHDMPPKVACNCAEKLLDQPPVPGRPPKRKRLGLEWNSQQEWTGSTGGQNMQMVAASQIYPGQGITQPAQGWVAWAAEQAGGFPSNNQLNSNASAGGMAGEAQRAPSLLLRHCKKQMREQGPGGEDGNDGSDESQKLLAKAVEEGGDGMPGAEDARLQASQGDVEATQIQDDGAGRPAVGSADQGTARDVPVAKRAKVKVPEPEWAKPYMNLLHKQQPPVKSRGIPGSRWRQERALAVPQNISVPTALANNGGDSSTAPNAPVEGNLVPDAPTENGPAVGPSGEEAPQKNEEPQNVAEVFASNTDAGVGSEEQSEAPQDVPVDVEGSQTAEGASGGAIVSVPEQADVLSIPGAAQQEVVGEDPFGGHMEQPLVLRHPDDAPVSQPSDQVPPDVLRAHAVPMVPVQQPIQEQLVAQEDQGLEMEQYSQQEGDLHVANPSQQQHQHRPPPGQKLKDFFRWKQHPRSASRRRPRALTTGQMDDGAVDMYGNPRPPRTKRQVGDQWNQLLAGQGMMISPQPSVVVPQQRRVQLTELLGMQFQAPVSVSVAGAHGPLETQLPGQVLVSHGMHEAMQNVDANSLGVCNPPTHGGVGEGPEDMTMQVEDAMCGAEQQQHEGVAHVTVHVSANEGGNEVGVEQNEGAEVEIC